MIMGNERLEQEAEEFQQSPVKSIKLPKSRQKNMAIKGMSESKAGLALKGSSDFPIAHLNRQ